MKKLFPLIFVLVIIFSLGLPSLALAQDVPNANITKRRPDRSATYSPSPVASPTTSPIEVKQVETSTQSFFAKLWDKIISFFANLFKQPEASFTTSSPTP